MSFDAQEKSVESASPVEFYTIAIGTELFRMHSSIEETITLGADVFYKTPALKRGHIATGQEYLTVELPGDHLFSKRFAMIAPGQAATLTIQSYHRGDTSDLRVMYKGVVRSVAFIQQGALSALSVIPISEAFDKTIPDRTFQAPCNNILFDDDCKISPGLWSYEDEVTAVNANTISVHGLGASKGDGWANGGFVSYGVLDYRLVLTQTGDVLTLVLPFYEPILGNDVTVYAGCDHCLTGDCQNKFDNTVNFSGFPYVPTKNIFATGL